MKKILFAIIFLFQFNKSNCQTFYNGDFETNTSSGCEYNLPDTIFNTKMPHVFAFGKTKYFNNYVGETDIQTTGCYITPQNGNWCIGIASDYSIDTTSDAVAIELTSNLTTGNTYQLSFYLFGNTNFTNSLNKVKIGESLTDSTFGAFIDSIAPVANSWTHIILNFTASQPSQYITVKNIPGVNAGWNQIDNFSLSSTTGINTILPENAIVNIFPNPTTGIFSITQSNIIKSVLEINNVYGELTYKTNIEMGQTTIDLSKEAKGIYFVKVTDNNRNVTNKKIILQ